MAETKEIDLGQFNIGDVDRIQFNIKKDGVAWDLTSATVTYTFENPDRSTQFDRTATISSASGGVVYYDTVVTDMTDVGYWKLRVKVVDGTITKRYPYEIGMYLNDQP